MTSKFSPTLSNEIKELYHAHGKWLTMKKFITKLAKEYLVTITQQDVYDTIFPEMDIAACGKKKKYTSFTEGYVFCGNKCQCAKLSWKEKTRETNLAKFGTEYALQNAGVRAKSRETNLARYGAGNPFEAKIFKDKIKESEKQ